MITFAEAKKLSILKWEFIYNHDGNSERLLNTIPELKNLYNNCGFCHLYKFNKDNDKFSCGKCPIIVGTLICIDDMHPFSIWTNNNTKQNAKNVLDIILNAKDPDDIQMEKSLSKITAIPKTAEEITGIKDCLSFECNNFIYLKEHNNIANKQERILLIKHHNEFYDYKYVLQYHDKYDYLGWKKEWLKNIQEISQEIDWSRFL